MALTMTRTRTQTTLTRLAKLLAKLGGELEFVDELRESFPEHRQALTLHRATLVANWGAVAAALRQFDPGIELGTIYVSRPKTSRGSVQLYLAEVLGNHG